MKAKELKEKYPLPPEHRWDINAHRTGISIQARATKFVEYQPDSWEDVYWALADHKGSDTFTIKTWSKTDVLPGHWVDYGTVTTLEDAASVMTTLCYMGVSDYKFRE